MFVIPDSYQGHIRRRKQQFENKEWIFQIYVFKTKTGKMLQHGNCGKAY